MASLTGNKIKDTYQSLLKTNDNGQVTNVSKNITDGFGSGSGLYLKDTGVTLSGSVVLSGISEGSQTSVLTYDTASGQIYYTASSAIGGGGSGIPGGSDTQIQFNSGSTFSGSGNFRYDYTNNNLSLTGSLDVSGSGNFTGELTLTGIQQSSQINFLSYDSASGQIYYQSTGSILASISATDASFAVNLATTGALPGSPVYDNGADGVGAFLSSSINVSLGSIDRVTASIGDRILVKNQASQLQNGVYEVTAVGSVSTQYVLTRTTDSDETSEIDSQIVIVGSGSVNGGGIFTQTTNNPTIGTDNIVYTRQASTVVTQTGAGTQAVYQIPWWTGTGRQLSKGSRNFTYTNVTVGNTVTTSSLRLTGSFDVSGSGRFTNGLTVTGSVTVSGSSTDRLQVKMNTYYNGNLLPDTFNPSSVTGMYTLGLISSDAGSRIQAYTNGGLSPIASLWIDNNMRLEKTGGFYLNQQDSTFDITGQRVVYLGGSNNGYVDLRIIPTINALPISQSNYYGVRFDPTITAINSNVRLIAFNNTVGDNVFNTTSGNVYIGTSATSSFKLDVSGSARVVGSGSAQPLLQVIGSQGELFTVTDSLSGSLFSVNDISGLPIVKVFSDNTLRFGTFQAPALNTTVLLSTTTSGVNTIYSVPTASYDVIYVDYSIRSGSVGRSGTFMAMWSGSTVNTSEISTPSFGDTSGFVIGANISGSNLLISGSCTTAGWKVKTIIKSI